MDLQKVISAIKTILDRGGDNIEGKAQHFLKIAINALKNAETVIDLDGAGNGCIVPLHFGGIPQEAVNVVVDMTAPQLTPPPARVKAPRPPYDFGDLVFTETPFLVEAFSLELHAATEALLLMEEPDRQMVFKELSMDGCQSLLLTEQYYDHKGNTKWVEDLDIMQFWTIKSPAVTQAKAWPQVLLFPVDTPDGGVLIEFFKIHKGNYKAVRHMRDAVRVARKAAIAEEESSPELAIIT